MLPLSPPASKLVRQYTRDCSRRAVGLVHYWFQRHVTKIQPQADTLASCREGNASTSFTVSSHKRAIIITVIYWWRIRGKRQKKNIKVRFRTRQRRTELLQEQFITVNRSNFRNTESYVVNWHPNLTAKNSRVSHVAIVTSTLRLILVHTFA